MEPRGRNRWQPVASATAPKTAKTLAVGCEELPLGPHGKEGVGGSSPPEGSTKAPESGAFFFRATCTISNMRYLWSRLWSLQYQNERSKRRIGWRRADISLVPARRSDSVDGMKRLHNLHYALDNGGPDLDHSTRTLDE